MIMKKIRLLESEEQIKSISLKAGYVNDDSRFSPSTVWEDAVLNFTSKRLHYLSNRDSYSISYKDVAGLEVSSIKLPARKRAYYGASILITLGFYPIMDSMPTLATVICCVGLFIVLPYFYFFNRKPVYYLAFVTSASEEIIGFCIEKNDDLLMSIEDAFENGIQNFSC